MAIRATHDALLDFLLQNVKWYRVVHHRADFRDLLAVHMVNSMTSASTSPQSTH